MILFLNIARLITFFQYYYEIFHIIKRRMRIILPLFYSKTWLFYSETSDGSFSRHSIFVDLSVRCQVTMFCVLLMSQICCFLV